jgi:hypothetical protein
MDGIMGIVPNQNLKKTVIVFTLHLLLTLDAGTTALELE